MSTNVSHRVPTRQAHALADLTGYEDADTLRWQQVCQQVAQRLTALPHGRFAYMTLERIRQGLDLAQRGGVTLADDPNDLTAEVRSGSARYGVNMAAPSCQGTDFQKRQQTCKHLLATEIHIGALALFRSTAPDETLDSQEAATIVPEKSAAADTAAVEETVNTVTVPAPSAAVPTPPAPLTRIDNPAGCHLQCRIGPNELWFTRHDHSDAALLARLQTTLPLLQDIVEACAQRYEQRPAAAEPSHPTPPPAPTERTLDEQIAAAVQASCKAQADASANGARKPPTAPMVEPTKDTDPSWCPIRRVQMERKTNERGSWWSHDLGQDAHGRRLYCRGE